MSVLARIDIDMSSAVSYRSEMGAPGLLGLSEVGC